MNVQRMFVAVPVALSMISLFVSDGIDRSASAGAGDLRRAIAVVKANFRLLLDKGAFNDLSIQLRREEAKASGIRLLRAKLSLAALKSTTPALIQRKTQIHRLRILKIAAQLGKLQEQDRKTLLMALRLHTQRGREGNVSLDGSEMMVLPTAKSLYVHAMSPTMASAIVDFEADSAKAMTRQQAEELVENKILHYSSITAGLQKARDKLEVHLNNSLTPSFAQGIVLAQRVLRKAETKEFQNARARAEKLTKTAQAGNAAFGKARARWEKLAANVKTEDLTKSRQRVRRLLKEARKKVAD